MQICGWSQGMYGAVEVFNGSLLFFACTTSGDLYYILFHRARDFELFHISLIDSKVSIMVVEEDTHAVKGCD